MSSIRTAKVMREFSNQQILEKAMEQINTSFERHPEGYRLLIDGYSFEIKKKGKMYSIQFQGNVFSLSQQKKLLDEYLIRLESTYEHLFQEWKRKLIEKQEALEREKMMVKMQSSHEQEAESLALKKELRLLEIQEKREKERIKELAISKSQRIEELAKMKGYEIVKKQEKGKLKLVLRRKY